VVVLKVDGHKWIRLVANDLGLSYALGVSFEALLVGSDAVKLAQVGCVRVKGIKFDLKSLDVLEGEVRELLDKLVSYPHCLFRELDQL